MDVKATLAAVTTGDADAAIVYVTDAKSAGSAVTAVTDPRRPERRSRRTRSWCSTSSNNQATAQAFVEYVVGPKGQATLKSYGFLPPT